MEVGTLAEMRHLSALAIEATFTGPPPDLSAVPGVSDVHVDGHQLRARVQGSVEPLLARLTAARVTEELFLARYGTPDGHTGQPQEVASDGH